MTEHWIARETTTHQDHVVAHVLGATALGYFVYDEVLHLILDIGFVWSIFVDGEMGLLPHPVAIGELELDEHVRSEVKADIGLLLSDNWSPEQLLRLSVASFQDNGKLCEISEVNFFEQNDRRRLLLSCEEGTLAIETSLTTGEIKVYDFN